MGLDGIELRRVGVLLRSVRSGLVGYLLRRSRVVGRGRSDVNLRLLRLIVLRFVRGSLVLMVVVVERLRVRLLGVLGRRVGGIGDVDERHGDEGRGGDVELERRVRSMVLRWWKLGRRQAFSSRSL